MRCDVHLCHECDFVIMSVIIVIIIKIIIALKGAIRDFYSLLTAPQTVSNTYTQVARAQSSAIQVQYIEHLSHATCCLLCGMKRQLSY